jgi:hypothetical protein
MLDGNVLRYRSRRGHGHTAIIVSGPGDFTAGAICLSAVSQWFPPTETSRDGAFLQEKPTWAKLASADES